MMKKLLCLIGIHDWRWTNFTLHVADRVFHRADGQSIVTKEIHYGEWKCHRCATWKLTEEGWR